MNLIEAEKVVNKYGSVLASAPIPDTASGMSYPISILPFTKEKIKEAIKVYYVECTRIGKLTPEIKSNLKVGYMTLACFISDDKTTGEAILCEQDKLITEFADFINDIKLLTNEVSKQKSKKMSKIVTYKKGAYCQIKLESGERFLISIAQSGIKISKLTVGGLVPTKTIWESNNTHEMVKLFADTNDPDRDLLDAIVAQLITCKTVIEVNRKLELN